MMSYTVAQRSMMKTSGTFFVLLLVLFAAMPGLVSAEPAMDQTCTQLSKYGFSAGLVYCVQASIGKATMQYITGLQGFLLIYLGSAAMVAFAVFGFKLMNSSIQEPVKDVSFMLLRLMVGTFFFFKSADIYNWIAGTLPNNDGIMNQAIGWVTNGTGFGSWGSLTSGGAGGSGGSIVASSCIVQTPPANYEGVRVWQSFDCMFAKIFGAIDPSTTTGANTLGTSLLVIIGAAFFSGTLGVTVASLGILAFFTALLLVFRGLFLVLLAYLCLGFLTIFGPLIAPLVFFDSKFLTEKFKRWLGLILSTMFQPVFVIGFLAMAIAVDDQIIEGTLTTGCHPPTYPGGSASEPPEHWGQDGTGVCSFTQLFYNGKSGGVLTSFFTDMLENNSTMFNWTLQSNPQGQLPTNGYGTANPFTDPTTVDDQNKNMTTNATQQIISGAANFNPGSTTRLKQYVPLKQFMMTLLTFIFLTYTMLQLLEVIPKMAADMTISVGLNLYSALQVPFEGTVRSMLSGGMAEASKAAKGKGLTSF